METDGTTRTNETDEIRKKNTFSDIGSWILWILFSPFLVPFFAFYLLFTFTYLDVLPIRYKLVVLGVVYCFTFLMPLLAFFLQRKVIQHRLLLYGLVLLCYVACFLTLYKFHVPRYLSGIVWMHLACMAFCAVANLKWRVSYHVAGSGLMTGALFFYSFSFHFNPVWWLCAFLLLAGLLGTERMAVGRYTGWEIFVGFVAGLFCGIAGILFI